MVGAAGGLFRYDCRRTRLLRPRRAPYEAPRSDVPLAVLYPRRRTGLRVGGGAVGAHRRGAGRGSLRLGPSRAGGAPLWPYAFVRVGVPDGVLRRAPADRPARDGRHAGAAAVLVPRDAPGPQLPLAQPRV